MNLTQLELIAIAVAAIIVGYAIYKILNKFGLIGTTPEEVGKKEFLNNPAVQGDQNTFLPLAGKAFKNKYKRPASANDIKLLTPLPSVITSIRKQLKDSRGFFNDNESAVLNVFRNIKSQLALYTISQNFQVYEKKSLIDYLSEFLDENELSKLNDIVKKLPII